MADVERLQQWAAVYETELSKAVQTHPTEYGFSLAAVPSVAGKMMVAFAKGSYNKDGRAIKATCKHFGIKYTYTAINAWLNGRQADAS